MTDELLKTSSYPNIGNLFPTVNNDRLLYRASPHCVSISDTSKAIVPKAENHRSAFAFSSDRVQRILRGRVMEVLAAYPNPAGRYGEPTAFDAGASALTVDDTQDARATRPGVPIAPDPVSRLPCR